MAGQQQQNNLAPRDASVDRGLDPTWPRVAIGAVGVALVPAAAVGAIRDMEGLSVASLLATGFALIFVGYLGKYIRSLKFREFEAHLGELSQAAQELKGDVRRVQQAADVAIRGLDDVARSYVETRAAMSPGGDRDDEMSADLTNGMLRFRQEPPNPQDIARRARSDDQGDRIAVLAALRANPELWDFDSVLYAIEHYKKPFDLDRFLLLAADMKHKLNAEERHQLRVAVEKLRTEGRIRPTQIRWLSSERLLRLLER
jgi:hypothetical protein